MSFGQCFVPPLVPTSKENAYDKKSLWNREKGFARFLRGITRSADLLSHPLVVEFLQVDHSKIDYKSGMKEFSKKLQAEESLLSKMNKDKIANQVFRVTYYKERYSLQKDFVDTLQARKEGKSMTQMNFDEKEYLLRYDQQVVAMNNLLAKFKTQLEDLHASNGSMRDNLKEIAKLYN